MDAIVSEARNKLQTESLNAALAYLAPFEKVARTDEDLGRSTAILELYVSLCIEAADWAALNENLLSLAKKRGQLKQATTMMVQKAMSLIDTQQDSVKKLQLIETLRQVTNGKIFVEVERAKLTKMLSSIKENEHGNLKEAAEILFELQVETFGSMSLPDKLDFLLDQMRLGLLIQDYTKTQIISRKINIKFFDEGEGMQQRKTMYYESMIQLALHDKRYLDCATYYLNLFHIPINEPRKAELLQYASLFAILSPFDHAHSDLVARLLRMKTLELLPQMKQLLTAFSEKEIMRWPLIEQMYSPSLRGTYIFTQSTADGVSRWTEFMNRVIEHNVRIIAGYYECIRLERLAQLLDVDLKMAEETLARLVVTKTIFAKLDRPTGLIRFDEPKNADAIIEAWSNDFNAILEQLVKVNHLIAKEEMLHSLQSAQ